MTWSYNSTAPNSSSMSMVRLLIGDHTSSSESELEDEDILAFIDSEGNTFLAAALACESIASRYSRRASQKVGELQIDLSDIAKAYREQAKTLRKRAEVGGSAGRLKAGRVYAGGISVSDREAVKADTDQVRGRIDVGFTDYAGFPKTPNEGSTEEG